MLRNLKALRRSRRLNQQELAELLHISQASISKYEMGLVEPDIYIIKQIAAFSRCPLTISWGKKRESLYTRRTFPRRKSSFSTGTGG